MFWRMEQRIKEQATTTADKDDDDIVNVWQKWVKLN